MAKKPVFRVTDKEMWDYEYQAKFWEQNKYKADLIILASNSLTNLKREIREKGVTLAWITCKSGLLSYGQNIVNEYPYKPR